MMMTIRPTLLVDLNHLSEFWYAQAAIIGQADQRFIPPIDARRDWEIAMQATLQEPKYIVLTALSEGNTPIGFVIGCEAPFGMFPSSIEQRMALIGELVIDAHGYHPGAARGLVLHLRALFAERGIYQLVALSPRRHVVGQAFWRSLHVSVWMDAFWLK